MYARATDFGEVGTVGYGGEYPRKIGNRFSLMIDGKAHRITNMVYENLRYLIDEGIASFPIECKVLENGEAQVVDKDVPDIYFTLEYLTEREALIKAGRLAIANFVDQEVRKVQALIDYGWAALADQNPNRGLYPECVMNIRIQTHVTIPDDMLVAANMVGISVEISANLRDNAIIVCGCYMDRPIIANLTAAQMANPPTYSGVDLWAYAAEQATPCPKIPDQGTL